MSEFIIFCIFAFFVYVTISGLKDTVKDARDTQIKIASGESPVEYLGGSPHINVASQGFLRPCANVLSFTYSDGNKPINAKWNVIKYVEIKNHEQITSDVTTGRVLLLGVFALAAKKQTVHRKEYLVIHCGEEETNYDMVFTGEGMGMLASRINRALIEYRKNIKSLITAEA